MLSNLELLIQLTLKTKKKQPRNPKINRLTGLFRVQAVQVDVSTDVLPYTAQSQLSATFKLTKALFPSPIFSRMSHSGVPTTDHPKYVTDTINTFNSLLNTLKQIDNPATALDLHLSLNARTDYIKITTEVLTNQYEINQVLQGNESLQELAEILRF